jgi:hypothetical protein
MFVTRAPARPPGQRAPILLCRRSITRSRRYTEILAAAARPGHANPLPSMVGNREWKKREMERGSHACRYLIADSTQLNFTSAERESERGCCGGTVSLALVAPMWRPLSGCCGGTVSLALVAPMWRPLSKARSRQRAVRSGALLYRIINYRWSKEIAIERQQIHL